MAGLFCEGFQAYADLTDCESVHGSGGNSGAWTFPADGRHDAAETVARGVLGGILNLRQFAPIPAGTDFFVHAACEFAVTTDTPSTHSIIDLRESSGGRVHIRISRASADTIEIYRRTTLLESVTISGVLSNNSWHIIEAKINVHDSAGTYEVKVDGVTVLSGTSVDTRDAGTGVVDELRLSCNTAQANSNSFDDVVLWDTAAGSVDDFVSELRVEQLDPSAAGSNSDFSNVGQSTNWENLVKDPIPNSLGSDYIESNVVTEKSTVAMTNGAISDAPLFVQLMYGALKEGAGSRSAQGIVRSSGGTEATGAANALGTGLAFYTDIFDDEPGGAAWNNTKIDGVEAGLSVQA